MKRSGEIILDSRLYFSEMLNQACIDRNVEAKPSVQNYIVNMLNSFLRTESLYSVSEKTGKSENLSLAELYLTAVNSTENKRINLLKRLADTSLYVSGFFGDSFKRKIIDLDYYVEMGETAYSTLSEETEYDLSAKVYKDIATQFTSFVDVLTLISQKCAIQGTDDILRLYDKYHLLDSELAKDQLVEQGVLNLPQKKSNKQ